MKKQWKKSLTVAAIVCAGPASAIPVTFDFSGTVAQVITTDFAGGLPTFDLSTAGQAFNAQFLIDTDLFSPLAAPPTTIGDRLAYNSELPGAVTSSLVVNGESIDLAPYARNRATASFIDSYGIVSCGENCSRLGPDQFNVNTVSEDPTPLGPAASRTLSFSFVAGYQSFDNPESALTWFDFSPDFDLTRIGSLPLLDSLLTTVTLTDFLSDCTDLRCQATATRRTMFQVTSTTRTVASVPEPGTLGLLAMGLAGAWFMRRRRPQPV
ncbi:MAG TPA: PEP-CTERM sorting domain-containing protein [Steroidobacteraceae bacterium]